MAGFRSGWLVVTGPKQHAASYIEGLTCWPTCGCAPTCPPSTPSRPRSAAASRSTTSSLPGGRLHEQRERAWELLNEIPGVSCVKPKGALYAFPRLDPKVYPIHDDEKFVLDLLLQEKILVVQGTGFNWPSPDHFRIVTLPHVDDLEAAIGRIGRFLDGYRQ